jgi:hypothetical protein
MAERLRTSIGVLWDWSNWQAQKDLWTLWGTVLGDSFLQPIDDVARGKVYISTLHPSIVRDLALDDFGNVKEYTIEYSREDPDSPTRSVNYVETCEHGEGTDIVFKTYKNNQEYAWDGRPSTWVEPYGFVPLVHNRHINVGKTWAWAEIYGALSKVRESDDIASKLSDHIRKSVDPAWLFNFSKPRKAGNQQLTTSEETLQRPHPGREEVPAIYASDTNAKGQALIGELNYQGVMLHLSGLVQQIERDYPELRFDNLRMEGSISGQALRTARQPATAKVQQRRAGYDKSLVRAQQMAIAIGGMRSYPEFAGFNLDSYGAGTLDHFIGTHPVFELDDFEAAEQEDMFWRTVQSARRAGADIKGYLQTKGWSDAKIELVMTAEALAGEPLPGEKAAIENARASRENRAKASGAIADTQDDEE